METAKGPQFLRFCLPIVETLKELGGSGQPKEVTNLVLERLHISEREQAQTNKNGGSRVRNQVAWARFYLAKADVLDASRRGVWALTERGRTTQLSPDAVIQLFKDVRTTFPTTGTFTTEATKEARRDGAPPIELVDGETLVQMFERLELGVKPKTIYEVDDAFFEAYR